MTLVRSCRLAFPTVYGWSAAVVECLTFKYPQNSATSLPTGYDRLSARTYVGVSVGTAW